MINETFMTFKQCDSAPLYFIGIKRHFWHFWYGGHGLYSLAHRSYEGYIPEGEQKAHNYTCLARSALCTGNYDLYALE